MDITVTANGYRIIDDSGQVTFFTLTYNGITYKWHGNTPVLTGTALQAHLDAHAEKYLCGIRRKMYPEAIITPEPGETERASWERWIAGGCKNIRQVVSTVDGEEITETVEDTVPVTPWKDTHPVSESPTTWL